MKNLISLFVSKNILEILWKTRKSYLQSEFHSQIGKSVFTRKQLVERRTKRERLRRALGRVCYKLLHKLSLYLFFHVLCTQTSPRRMMQYIDIIDVPGRARLQTRFLPKRRGHEEPLRLWQVASSPQKTKVLSPENRIPPTAIVVQLVTLSKYMIIFHKVQPFSGAIKMRHDLQSPVWRPSNRQLSMDRIGVLPPR